MTRLKEITKEELEERTKDVRAKKIYNYYMRSSKFVHYIHEDELILNYCYEYRKCRINMNRYRDYNKDKYKKFYYKSQVYLKVIQDLYTYYNKKFDLNVDNTAYIESKRKGLE